MPQKCGYLEKHNELRSCVFERENFEKNISTFEQEYEEKHNEELNVLYQKPGIIKEKISKIRLNWTRHAWKKQGSLVRKPSLRKYLAVSGRREDCMVTVGRLY